MMHIVFKSDDTDYNRSLDCSPFYAEEFGASFELTWSVIEDLSNFQQLLNNTGSFLHSSHQYTPCRVGDSLKFQVV